MSRPGPLVIFLLLLIALAVLSGADEADIPPSSLHLVQVITGEIRPKSIIYAGNGHFFAQNMMYRHSVTVYDRQYRQIGEISDEIRLSDFHRSGFSGLHRGSPVEATAGPDGSVWITNYQMYGQGFDHPGSDNCQSGTATYDHSYVYKVNPLSLQIENIIEVGAVPKYIAATPDGQYLLVSNWCSGDLSIIRVTQEAEMRRIPLGAYPRGIAIDAASRYAYVTVMGDSRIAVIKLSDFSITWLEGIGRTPRHICLDPSERFLYCTLSREGTVIKIDLVSGKVVRSAYIGREARSMCLSPDGTHLYAVAYEDNRLVKLTTADLTKVATEPTRQQPIGVTCDPETGAVWVACYSGSIMVFEDTRPTLAYAPVPVAPAPEAQSLRYVPGNLVPNPGPVFYERQAQPTSRSADTPVLASRKYYIVIGSYSRLENARIIYNKLKAKGLQPEIISGENNWRVSLSQHTSYEEATEALTKAKQQYNTECWILTR